MKDEFYINILGWMITKLNLKGNELILFASIYGFCQGGENIYEGSLNYMARCINASKPTALKTINNLIKKNLILKEVFTKNSVQFNHYNINFEEIEKIFMGSKETLPGSKETLPGGSKETLPNNNINNNIYKGKDLNPDKEIPKITLGEINTLTGIKKEKEYKTEKEILNKVAHLFESKYYNTENKKKAWLEEIRKLIEIDKETPETIIQVIEFAKQDDFWNQNLLSIQALRKKNKSGVMKYDNIKAKLPKQQQTSLNNGVYKNGAKPAKESDIITTLGDEATYRQNVIECKMQYVEFDSKVYVVRKDIKGRYIITSKGRIEI